MNELKSVARVRFEGRRHLGVAALKRVLKTKGRSIWPWRQEPTLRVDYLRADVAAIENLYRRYGYLDARAAYQVTSSRRSDEVDVLFTIVEGERSVIRSVSFTGAHAVPERDLRRRLWSRPGRPFDPAYLQLDTLRISQVYAERGYLPRVVGIAARDRVDSLEVAVAYAITEGERFRFGATAIEGRSRVKEALVRRELIMPEGTIYQLSRVVRSQERLYETGLFSQAQIEGTPDADRRVMDMQVRLRERRPRWIDAGIGSGTEERLRLLGEWGHRSVLGQALQGVVSSRLAIDSKRRFKRWHVEGSLLQPWLWRSRTRAQVTPFYERNDDRAFDSLWVVRQEFRGVNLTLRRELDRITRISLSQENLWARQELDVNRNVVLDSLTRDSLSREVVPRYTTHRLVLAFERDSRDNPFSPLRGATSIVTAEVAGGPFRGTSSFRKFQASNSAYQMLPNGWVLAGKLVGGVIEPFGPRPSFSPRGVVDAEVARVPLEDRFRIGGVNSLRYYDEASIPGSGGLAVIQANLEARIPTNLRVPFLGNLGFEVYLDAGNVWARPEYIRWAHFSAGSGTGDANAVRYVVGLGPRVDLPVGPLRLDLSWQVRPTATHPRLQFAIGPSF